MKNIIIIEYLTSLNKKSNFSKQIFAEAINIISCLSENFKSKNKILFIRNKIYSRFDKPGVKYLETDSTLCWKKIIKKFDPRNTLILLIAPESGNSYFTMARYLLEKKFEILNSDLDLIKTFSSKKFTFQFLKKNKIPCIDIIKGINSTRKIIIKPDFGTGSEKIMFRKAGDKIFKGSHGSFDNCVIQEYLPGLVGSVNLLCQAGKNNLLSCNRHITSKSNKSIKQIGSIIGGLEKHRKELKALCNKLTKKFVKLFGFIGIDVIFDNNQWKILEVNSRITSTYCGLERAYGKEIQMFITSFYLKKKFTNKTFGLIKEYKLLFK